MEHHIDRRVVLSQDSEYKNLYAWSLVEFDAEGNKVGRDQIPWGSTLYFSATELTLRDTLNIRPEYRTDDKSKVEVRERQFIRARLSPQDGGGRGRFRDTAYSMFGTDRTISSFELQIEQLEGDDEQARCTSWGIVSYTSEVDFVDETTDDIVAFCLYVTPATFARYAAKIAAAEIDEATLRVGGVAGFYSDWSPSISTDSVKVLTSYKEHEVETPEGCEIIPPRLGSVDEAEFYLGRVRNLEIAKRDPDDENPLSDDGHDGLPTDQKQGDYERQSRLATHATNNRAVGLLSNLRVAAWLIVALLVLLFLK